MCFLSGCWFSYSVILFFVAELCVPLIFGVMHLEQVAINTIETNISIENNPFKLVGVAIRSNLE